MTATTESRLTGAGVGARRAVPPEVMASSGQPAVQARRQRRLDQEGR